jgi:hypothetical protein
MNIRTGADHTAWFVQCDIIALSRLLNHPCIEQNFIGLRVYFCAQFSDDMPVHSDPTREYPGFAGSPRADAGGGERFLQSFHKSFPLPPKALAHPRSLSGQSVRSTENVHRACV